MSEVLPKTVGTPHSLGTSNTEYRLGTREEFIKDVEAGINMAPMSIRLTPHVLSVIDWTKPFLDPARRQFIPVKSYSRSDHPRLTLDSLNEIDDSPVPGIVHRYPDKVLFLGIDIPIPIKCY